MIRKASNALAFAAYGWAVFNCALVYFLEGGARSYRAESAAMIVVAVLLVRAAVSGEREQRDADWSGAQVLFVAGIAVIAWLVILGPFVRFTLLSDDYVFLSRDGHWSDPAQSRLQFFRPIFTWTFFIAQKIGGGSSVPFHVASFALHLASAVATYFLALRIFARRSGAVFAAVVFLLSPTQPETVLWASGLQDVLWTAFALWAAVFLRATAIESRARVLLAVGLAALALLSKETAVCVPAILVLFAAATPGWRPSRGAVAVLAVFVLEVIAYLVVRYHFVGGLAAHIGGLPSRYAVKQFLTTPYRILAFPWSADAVRVPAALEGGLAMLALTILAATTWRPLRPVVAGPLAILISTLPLLGFFYVAADLSGTRYLYFASSGWGLFTAAALMRYVRNVRAQQAIAIALLAVFAVVLRLNLRPWYAVDGLMRELDASVSRGTPPSTVFAAWRATHPQIEWDARGLPDNYEGVYVFRNGFDEYLRLHAVAVKER